MHISCYVGERERERERESKEKFKVSHTIMKFDVKFPVKLDYECKGLSPFVSTLGYSEG